MLVAVRSPRSAFPAMQRPGLLKIPTAAEGMGLGLESPAFLPMNLVRARTAEARSAKRRIAVDRGRRVAARALTPRFARPGRQLSPPAAHGDVLALFGSGGAVNPGDSQGLSSAKAAGGAGRFSAGDAQGEEEPDELAVRCATREPRCAGADGSALRCAVFSRAAGAGRPGRRLHMAQVRAEGHAGRGCASQLLQVQRGRLRRQEAGTSPHLPRPKARRSC